MSVKELTIPNSTNLYCNNLEVDGTLNLAGSVKFTSTIDSTSITSGALVVNGGVGIGKNLYVGETLAINNYSYPIQDSIYVKEDEINLPATTYCRILNTLNNTILCRNYDVVHSAPDTNTQAAGLIDIDGSSNSIGFMTLAAGDTVPKVPLSISSNQISITDGLTMIGKDTNNQSFIQTTDLNINTSTNKLTGTTTFKDNLICPQIINDGYICSFEVNGSNLNANVTLDDPLPNGLGSISSDGYYINFPAGSYLQYRFTDGNPTGGSGTFRITINKGAVETLPSDIQLFMVYNTGNNNSKILFTLNTDNHLHYTAYNQSGDMTSDCDCGLITIYQSTDIEFEMDFIPYVEGHDTDPYVFIYTNGNLLYSNNVAFDHGTCTDIQFGSLTSPAFAMKDFSAFTTANHTDSKYTPGYSATGMISATSIKFQGINNYFGNSCLNTYTESTLTGTTTGCAAVPYTIYLSQVGSIVNLTFPTITFTAGTDDVLTFRNMDSLLIPTWMVSASLRQLTQMAYGYTSSALSAAYYVISNATGPVYPIQLYPYTSLGTFVNGTSYTFQGCTLSYVLANMPVHAPSNDTDSVKKVSMNSTKSVAPSVTESTVKKEFRPAFMEDYAQPCVKKSMKPSMTRASVNESNMF